MVQTENDYFEMSHNGRGNPQDFQASTSPYISRKITYYQGFHSPHFYATSFVVDWQQQIEESSDAELW